MRACTISFFLIIIAIGCNLNPTSSGNIGDTDTLVVLDTIIKKDTVLIMKTDTIKSRDTITREIRVIDTIKTSTILRDTIRDTIIRTVSVHDTINKIIRDTIVKSVFVHDTIYRTTTIKDTIIIQTGSNTYNGGSKGHWISQTYSVGSTKIIKLEDGSFWKPISTYNMLLWMIIDDIEIYYSTSTSYPFTLVNKDRVSFNEYEMVDCKFLGYNLW